MEETEISTPDVTVSEDTSTTVGPEQTTGSDTSTIEPDNTNDAAETETSSDAQNGGQPSDVLYAGKYKSVEELEKGYNEAQKSVSKAAELEKKYNELLARQEEQARKLADERAEYAKSRGFKTAEEAEIADRVKLAEFEYYANNINSVPPEYFEKARENLLNYYNTANKAYLDEAKRYFSADFIEQTTLAKANLERQLTAELNQKQQALRDENEQKLAETLKTDFAEFLSDVSTNEGKSQALKAFCDADFITSKEDMRAFENIYSKIAKYEREQAIKEYEASKTIAQTKHSASIDTGAGQTVLNKQKPTYEELMNLPMEEFDKFFKKEGLKEILEIANTPAP